MFEEFKQLGFTDKEIKVYMCLIMLGKSNVQQICQQTKIFRTSVYSVLGRLIEKGLVSKTVKEKAGRQVEHFTPNDPSVLVKHIQHQRLSLVDKETAARNLISRITSQLYPKVRYESGREHVCQGVQDFLNEVKTLAKEQDSNRLLIYQNPTFYAEYAEDILPLIADSNLPIDLLMINDDDNEFVKLPHVTACTLPEKLAPFTTLFCHSHVALLVVCQPDLPHYAFSVKDNTIAQDCQRLLLGLLKNVKDKRTVSI